MNEIQGVIRFWERVLFDFQFLMEPSTKALVEITIRLLKEHEKIKGGQ